MGEIDGWLALHAQGKGSCTPGREGEKEWWQGQVVVVAGEGGGKGDLILFLFLFFIFVLIFFFCFNFFNNNKKNN